MPAAPDFLRGAGLRVYLGAPVCSCLLQALSGCAGPSGKLSRINAGNGGESTHESAQVCPQAQGSISHAVYKSNTEEQKKKK